MAMMGRNYGPGADMTKKMKLMVVRSYAYDKPGMYRMEDVEAYVKKLEDGSWSCPIVSREKEKEFEKLSGMGAIPFATAHPERTVFAILLAPLCVIS